MMMMMMMMSMLSVPVRTRSNVAALGTRENSEAQLALGLWHSELQEMRRQHVKTFTVLTVYQVTIHNKCSNWPPLYQCTQGHVWSRTVAPFLMSWGGCEWSDRHQICVSEASNHFQLELNTLHFSSVPTVKNLQDWSRANAEAVPWTFSVCGHILIWNFLLALVWGTHSWNFPTFQIYHICTHNYLRSTEVE